MAELSPMMTHYLQVKEKHKDCIIFYRLGDFYEMFFDDAIKASSILNLTLTGRDCGLEERAPMCGVPYHAADGYISKLVSVGEKVAICEQLTEPNGKNLVERDVIRIITAGTVTNNEYIDDRQNNFLVSVCIEKDKCAMSWVDITTGEFFAKCFNEDALSSLMNSLVKVSPVEIISNREAYEVLNESPLIKQGVLPKASLFTESEYNYENAKFTLLKQMHVSSLSTFGIENDSLIVCSSGAIISYLKETQKNVLSNIENIVIEDDKKYMMLDSTAIRNLELVKTIRDGKRYGSLLWLLDKTKTSMGARKLQSYIVSPLTDIEKINYRLDGVESFYNNTLTRQSAIDLLLNVKDIGRLTGRISNGNLQPKDCIALAKSLEILPNLKFLLTGINSEIVSDISNNLNEYKDLISLINVAIYENTDIDENKKSNVRYIKKGYNEELDSLRNLTTNGKESIAKIENDERTKTGIKNLKIGYNKVFGYYIEITNSFKDKVPYEYIRRQTLTNAERYVTQELKDIENKLLNAEELANNLEIKLYNEIKFKLLDYVSSLMKTAEAIAELDVILSFATVAKENGYVKPEVLTADKKLNIVEGRHPVVEAISKQRFIPNDCVLDNDENRTAIITGPNMAGKSTFMRQVALITLMAHIGSFVPASSAEIPLTDKIFTRIGASDSLISDQSTFMVEMSEMAYIIKNATSNSLLLLDEIGRGTSTIDGLSIAWSVVEYLTEKIKAKTLFATHYHELTDLEGKIEGVKNYKVTVKEMNGSIIFLRKIMRGGTNRSFGIEVASLAGVDKDVIDRAKEIMIKIEKNEISVPNDSFESLDKKEYSEVESILKDINVNTVSPMQALSILSDLCEKVK